VSQACGAALSAEKIAARALHQHQHCISISIASAPTLHQPQDLIATASASQHGNLTWQPWQPDMRQGAPQPGHETQGAFRWLAEGVGFSGRD